MSSIRRVLIVQPYGLGDALFMTPLLRALRTLPTVEAVDLLLGSRTEPVFRNNPHVDQISSIDKDKWHDQEKRGEVLGDLLRLWRKLRGRYDLLIDFSLQREYAFYGEFFLRIPRRIGFNFKNRGLFFTQAVPLKKGYEGAHAVDFYCEVGKLIGLEIEDRFLEFYVSEEDREEAARIKAPERYLALAPGGGESWGKDAFFKRWPAGHFIEMLARIKEHLNFEAVLVFGSRDERGLGEEVENNCKFPVFNLCGELSLGVSAALLEKAMLFLGNDGGLVHLAHALHIPVIAFYGPVDHHAYGPYPLSRRAISIAKGNLPCRPCYTRFRYNSACVDRECLTALSPQEAIEFLNKENFWSVLCESVF